MKIYFEKGMNHKKPKRWYPCNWFSDTQRQSPAHYSDHLVFSYSLDYYKFKNKLETFGFIVSKESPYSGGPIYPYLYFRSHAEEARFILWASNGVEV